MEPMEHYTALVLVLAVQVQVLPLQQQPHDLLPLLALAGVHQSSAAEYVREIYIQI